MSSPSQRARTAGLFVLAHSARHTEGGVRGIMDIVAPKRPSRLDDQVADPGEVARDPAIPFPAEASTPRRDESRAAHTMSTP